MEMRVPPKNVRCEAVVFGMIMVTTPIPFPISRTSTFHKFNVLAKKMQKKGCKNNHSFVSAMLVVAYLNTVTSSFCWPSWYHDLMQTCLSFYLIDRFWEELRSLTLSWLCEDMYIVYIIPAYALYCSQSTLTIWSTKDSQIKAVFTSERYRPSRAMQSRRCVSAEWASWDICCRNHRSIQTLHKSAKQLQTVKPEHPSRIAIWIVQTSNLPIWK